ncbi:cytochrome c nitrite reductase small subunit [Roseisolibacter sp. H3M3-2]|uniref:cytochrome c nitrite reductase small subunit n=1 Tax=Roseisolibacter sp. H3M3-2 TaxID=3031323 RepID=UPI0023DA2C54|nr:cytochrome c nitrite reductase small subunit [Roseisolibacter sp. H3M3-2]MDF1504215.1 cytochrome c nitrite reductase small subunit [Roseisolibacter sp. H3M3-2]
MSGADPRGAPPPDTSLGIRARTKWLLAATVALGLVAGLGAFTFGFARGHSYLTDDPAACANCHVMEDYYAAWTKGSHRAVATCNSCHTPHGLMGKYATKALNGFWHSFYFTTGNYPDPIRITPRNRQITERACRDCHQAVTASITPGAHVAPSSPQDPRARDDAWRTGDGRMQAAAHAATGEEDRSASCVRCHAAVGHWVR